MAASRYYGTLATATDQAFRVEGPLAQPVGLLNDCRNGSPSGRFIALGSYYFCAVVAAWAFAGAIIVPCAANTCHRPSRFT